MSQINPTPRVTQEAFGLAALLEFVTLCGIVAGLSSIVGPAASVCLMLLALALWARQGVLALLLFVGLIVAPVHAPTEQISAHLVTFAAAVGLCGWYAARRTRLLCRSRPNSTADEQAVSEAAQQRGAGERE